MEIKLPKSTKDLRIRHYEVLKNPIYQGDMNLELMVEFLSDFTGVPKSEIKRIDILDVMKMYNHCAELYTGYKPSDPKKEVEINGIKYKLINPEKVSTGWHIDFNNTDVTSEFVRLSCLFYYPSDGVYGDTDVNDNLIHPIHERYEDFKNHFPMTDFIDCSAFFLRCWNKSISASMASLKIKMLKQRIRRLIGLNGRKR